LQHDFAEDLLRWHADAIAITQGAHSIANVITGDAQVGKAYQGRDNLGTINM
jgi:hypothetical protein